MTDVFLVCFSLVDKESFNNALNKWITEIYQNANAPIILVGTKLDLKKEFEASGKGPQCVSQADVRFNRFLMSSIIVQQSRSKTQLIRICRVQRQNSGES